MKRLRINRRRFLLGAILAAPCLAYADAKWIEPTRVKVRRIRLGASKPRHRFVHFTDVHHKGDSAYLQSVVRKINALSPEFVCFTGDVIEETKHLPEAIEIFSGIKSPLFGIPGNHDYWSKAPFDGLQRCFSATGGAWLLDEQRPTADGNFVIHGVTCLGTHQPPIKLNSSAKNIFLMHYPAWVGRLEQMSFDLILAGHSHGGQVRLPFIGALFVPYGVEKYEIGMFQTARGPLYVNPGIGWFPWPIRFNCRPEITVFEV